MAVTGRSEVTGCAGDFIEMIGPALAYRFARFVRLAFSSAFRR